MSLTKDQEKRLSKHKVHHTKKHMDFMKEKMAKFGMSFAKAHRQALKIKGK
tara:strand:+ start:128 stop:280 length:153 start_codon:yes stop_codon:yes gene_type:complete